MANKQVGNTPVKRRTECFNDEDWNEFNKLVSVKWYDLNGVSSLHRLFLRVWQKFHDKSLIEISQELSIEGFEPTLHGLIKKIREENDRIQPTTKDDGPFKTNKNASTIINNAFPNIINPKDDK